MDIPSRDRDFERCPQCGATVDMTDPQQLARHMQSGHETVIPPTPEGDRGGLLEGNEHPEEVGYFETCRACCQTTHPRDPAEVLQHKEPGHKPLLPVV
jgi:hypothetical protein